MDVRAECEYHSIGVAEHRCDLGGRVAEISHKAREAVPQRVRRRPLDPAAFAAGSKDALAAVVDVHRLPERVRKIESPSH